MCSYNILKTMLVWFYPVLVECIADILVYLTASTTSTSSAGNNSMKICLGMYLKFQTLMIIDTYILIFLHLL